VVTHVRNLWETWKELLLWVVVMRVLWMVSVSDVWVL
jgi:hypothetical protein